MGKGVWASKIQVFNISGEGFRKTKNQRRTQVKKKWGFFDDFSRISCDFSLYFFIFLDYMMI